MSQQARVCIVTTHKTLPEETVQFVNYHLNAGFDAILLFLDNPSDKAYELLKDYSRVTCIRCDHVHWAGASGRLPVSLDDKQTINANLGLRWAREKGFDWILHIDSDELVYSKREIASLLSSLSSDVQVARFETYEAVPTQTEYPHPFVEMNLFRACPSKENIDRALALGCRKAFFNGEYFRGHTVGKSAVRTASEHVKSMGVHAPVSTGDQALKVEALADTKLLHFDSRGFRSWKDKWATRASGETLVPLMRENRRDQLAEYVRRCQKNAPDESLSALYRSLYFIPEEEQVILMSLGMLMRIELNGTLFADPAERGTRMGPEQRPR